MWYYSIRRPCDDIVVGKVMMLDAGIARENEVDRKCTIAKLYGMNPAECLNPYIPSGSVYVATSKDTTISFHPGWLVDCTKCTFYSKDK